MKVLIHLKAAGAALAAAVVLATGLLLLSFAGASGNAARAADPPSGAEKPVTEKETNPVIEIHWTGSTSDANVSYRFAVTADGSWEYNRVGIGEVEKGKLSTDDLNKWINDIVDGGLLEQAEMLESGQARMNVTVQIKGEKVTRVFRPADKLTEAITRKVDELARSDATIELTVVEVNRLRTGRATRENESEPLILVAKAAAADGNSIHIDVSWEVATRLKQLGIEDPAEHFKGKVVRVRGTIKRLMRRPGPASSIEVKDLDQFEVIRTADRVGAVAAEGAGDKEKPKTAKLWAGVSASSSNSSSNALFTVREAEQLKIGFAIVNDGADTVPFERGETELVINGQPLSGFGQDFRKGPVWDRLVQGKPFSAALGLGKHFAKPGVYKVHWRGKGFESAVLEFRVVSE